MDFDPSIIPYTKYNLRGIIDLSEREDNNAIKENIGDYVNG